MSMNGRTFSANAGNVDFVMMLSILSLSSKESKALHHEAIPDAAIPNCTNHFSLVNTLWESEFDLACSIEEFQLFGGEFQIKTGEIVLELGYLPRSDDRDYRHPSTAQPGECDLRHAATGLN